jgi:hypothetical protein
MICQSTNNLVPHTVPRTSIILRALPGLFVAASIAHAEPARLAAPPAGALPKASRAWLDDAIAASCGSAARKDPRYFLAWLDATLDARVMTALAAAPNKAGITPETARNMAEFNDPMLYIRWLLTGTDPVYFKAIVERAETAADDKAARAEARAWRRLPGFAAPPGLAPARY